MLGPSGEMVDTLDLKSNLIYGVSVQVRWWALLEKKRMGFFIDNMYYQEKDAVSGTIFQKCSTNGIDLPCFCYHESLSIAGNCRMCLVEASNSLKLVVSCAMPMAEEIKVYTNNVRIKKARESVLEFLLINHPLDCPICDQGGDVICRILL